MDDSEHKLTRNENGSNKSKLSIGDRPLCFKTTLHEVSFVLLAALAMATNSLITGAMIIVTAPIGKDLNMSQAQITWISAATTLTAGAFQLPLGQLTDLLGRRLFLLIGTAGFSLSCLILGFAKNPFWMNILCGLVGLFSAVVVPPAAGILGAAYSQPCRRKNWAFACFSAGTPVGFGLGSIIMGVAARLSSWRAGFWFFAVAWGVLSALSFWVVPGIEAHGDGSFRERLGIAVRRFDFAGTVLTVLGVGLLTTGLTLGPSDGWKTGHVIAMLIVGFALLVAFVFWENHYTHPLMPPYIWKDTKFSLVSHPQLTPSSLLLSSQSNQPPTQLIPITVSGMISLISSNFWLALFLQDFHHLDALSVAIRMLAQVVSAIAANIAAAVLLHRVNNTLIMAFGALMYVLANTLLAVQNPDAVYWAFIFPSLVTNVMGLDLQFNVANMYIMQSLPSQQQSLAAGVFNMFIRLGTTIGLGISTAVYSSVLEKGGGDAFYPFKSAFFVSVGFAVLGCVFVPFLRIGRQGIKEE
ncbi:major facilitator superfamily domain-containing protein [Aspergillus karnatakaensis]|uniref:major facilitator superfamily domain-containing protein n=1 Tax=Aspergillus karnatakaensis TaxID=1810916 RepID=UPI003CCD5DC3